jgi:hypothetical protein
MEQRTFSHEQAETCTRLDPPVKIVGPDESDDVGGLWRLLVVAFDDDKVITLTDE